MTGTFTRRFGFLVGIHVVVPNFFGKCQIAKLFVRKFVVITVDRGHWFRRNEDRSVCAKGLDMNRRFVGRIVVCGQKVDVMWL